MTPTEQEGTAAVDAAARKLWELQEKELHERTDGQVKGPTFDQLKWHVQNQLREQVLPVVWAALGALPDRRADGWDEGLKAGESHERAKWYWQGGNRAAMAAAGMPVESPVRPENPYRGAGE